MPILRSAKEKRDRTWGLAFGWRGEPSRLPPLLLALIFSVLIFAMAGYTLRITLADDRGTRPIATPLLLLQDLSDPEFSLRTQHEATETALLQKLATRVDRLTRPATDRPLTLASLPRTFGPTGATLPSPFRPGYQALPPVQQVRGNDPPSETTAAPQLAVTSFGDLADRAPVNPDPLELAPEPYFAQLGQQMRALITIDERGSVTSCFIIAAEDRATHPLIQDYLRTLTFAPGQVATGTIDLAIVLP